MRPLAISLLLVLGASAAGAQRRPHEHQHPAEAAPAKGARVDAGVEAGANAAMHGHMAASPHLRMSPVRTATAADSARALEIVAALRGALAPYADTAAAVADGYRMFAPELKRQPVFHFTKGGHALRNELGFDAARPTSLLYERGPDGRLRLTGAMYTAPRRSKPEDLDARVPLGIARWHLHTNVCVPKRSERERWRELQGARMVFGPAGVVATEAGCDAVGGRFHEEIMNWMVHVDVRHGDDLGAAFGEHH